MEWHENIKIKDKLVTADTVHDRSTNGREDSDLLAF
jgi:hypothetical protein